jgi:molybdopterin-binding protein
MADTTTTNFELVKPEVGASADTWGGKLNGNFDIIDTALAADVDLTADVTGTLPIANGGTNATTAAAARTSLGLGGTILQVVQGSTTTSVSVTTATTTDTTLTATITPSSASSKILVLVAQHMSGYRETRNVRWYNYLVRGATVIRNVFIYYTDAGTSAEQGALFRNTHPIVFLDSPNTTGATTYKTQINLVTTADNMGITAQPGSDPSYIVLIEVAG